MLETYYSQYKDALNDTDSTRAFDIIDKALKNNLSPQDIIFKIISPSIEENMTNFLNNDIILSQHFLASQISSEVIDKVLENFEESLTPVATVVIGCAFGDFHGLGKKIVSGCLKSNMFKVIDLGLNVSATKFVDTALENNASVIGISSMMVHTALSPDGPQKVRTILKNEGLESKIKLVVGGAPYTFDKNLYEKVNADAWASNGIEATNVISQFINGEK